MLIYESADTATAFIERLEEEFAQTLGGVMLTGDIHKSYMAGVEKRSEMHGVKTLAKGNCTPDLNIASPILFQITSDLLKMHPDLSEELFGPTSVVVEADGKKDLIEIARNLRGHLTATVHGTDRDLVEYKDLLDILEQKVGRLLINGFPTGVEVCSAMVHGGPFPATTDQKTTSVGTAAIDRFTRPVCYQNMPDQLLPDELKNANPLNIWRLVNGNLNKEVIK